MDCSARGSRAHSQIAQGLTPFRVPCNCKNSSKARTAYLLAVAEGRGAGHLRTDVRRPICENALVMTFPGLTMIWLLGDQLVGTHSTAGFGTLSKIAKGDLWSLQCHLGREHEGAKYVCSICWTAHFSVFWSL